MQCGRGGTLTRANCTRPLLGDLEIVILLGINEAGVGAPGLSQGLSVTLGLPCARTSAVTWLLEISASSSVTRESDRCADPTGWGRVPDAEASGTTPKFMARKWGHFPTPPQPQRSDSLTLRWEQSWGTAGLTVRGVAPWGSPRRSKFAGKEVAAFLPSHTTEIGLSAGSPSIVPAVRKRT